MTVQYYPKLNPDNSPIPGQSVAVAVLLPDGYTSSKRYPWVLMVHGMGERSAGTKENLENLVLGQKQPDGTRKWPFVKDFHKEAVDKYGMVFVVPTYETNAFFDPARVNWIYDFVKTMYSLVDKFLDDGFSYGGGSCVSFATSSVANAQKVAVSVPCAPTSSIINALVVGQANLPVHIFVNDEDDNPNTDIDVTRGIVKKINDTHPAIKVQYTAFHQTGHGGFDQATTIIPPIAPGGQGVTNLAENIYEWYLDVLARGPRQMRAEGATIPVPPVDPVPIPETLTAAFNLTEGQLITTPTYQMDASASTGVKTGWDGYYWDVIIGEGGEWSAMPEGGAAGGPLKKLIGLGDGKYTIRLTVKDNAGKTASNTVNIIVNTSGTKVVTGFDSSTDLISYSDGSSESGKAVLTNSKWTITNEAGQVVN